MSVDSVDALITQLVAIEAALPPGDGVACFNRMYRLVTQSVQQHLSEGTFDDPAWLSTLDVVFGNLFLGAIAPGVTGPRAWAPLLDRRADRRVTSLQFALAGMNAHINHDLPLAVVNTCEQRATTPDAHYADFERVNAVLAEVEPPIRQSFEDAVLQAADRAVPGLQDVVANFDMAKARQTAWANATTLWSLKSVSPALESRFLDGLDHLVGFAGRGLLVPLL